MEMKNRLPIIILAVALLISLGGNVYLIANQSALKNQLTDANNLLAEANSRIDDLNNHLSDYEYLKTQIADLQEQITQSNEQIETLENSLAEKDAQIEADKALAEQVKQENEARESGQTIVQPTMPEEEYTDFVIPEGFGGPVEITPDSPGYWDVDTSQLGEGSSSIDTSGLIVH